MSRYRTVSNRLIALGAGTSLLALATPAVAQSVAAVPAANQGDNTAPPTAEEERANNGDIVVTARRTRESSQRVPVAIEALTAADLRTRQVNSREQLSQNIAGLTNNSSNSGDDKLGFFMIRGQGQSFGGLPGVSTYFADVPGLALNAGPLAIEGRPGSFLDLENVQVLKGPQGTLFGRNSTGGAVLFVPQRPTNDAGGYVQAAYGNYNNARVEGAVNVPLVDGVLLARVAGAVEHQDGFTKDVGSNFRGRGYQNLNYQTVRASLLFKPSEAFENYTIGRFYRGRDNGPAWVLTAVNPTSPNAAVFTPLLAAQRARGNREVAYNNNDYTRANFYQLLNTTTVKAADFLTIRNIVSFARMEQAFSADIDGSSAPVLDQTGRWGKFKPRNNVFTEELQALGNAFDGKLTFAIGLYYDRLSSPGPYFQDFRFYPFVPGAFPDPAPNTVPGYTSLPGYPLFLSSDLTNTNKAAYAQGTLDLGLFIPALTGLKLTAGRRYTREEARTDSNFVASNILSIPAKSDFKNNYPSFTYGLDYQVSPSTLLYVSVRNAFKAGGVNAGAVQTSNRATYGPEELKSYEAGIKTTVRVGETSIRFAGDVFRGDYNNVQRSIFGDPACAVGCVANAAKARINGAEGDINARFSSAVSLYGSATYLDSKYTEVDPLAAAALLGAPFPNVPKFRYVVGGNLVLPFSSDSLGRLTFDASYSHQSKISYNIDNGPAILGAYLPGYGTANIGLRWDGIAGRSGLSANFYMRNVTNKEYQKARFDFYNTQGFASAQYGEPRTYGVQLRQEF